jgi:hypothetical protein
VLALALLLPVWLLPADDSRAQAGVPTSGSFLIERIEIRVDGVASISREQDADLRRYIGVFPGRYYNSNEIDLALTRLRKAPGVAGVAYRFEFGAGAGVVLRIDVQAAGSPAPPPTGLAERVVLYDDGTRLLKLRLGLKGATAVSVNQWFNNGSYLTEYNPRGVFDGGTGPNVAQDLAPSIGLAGALPLGSGRDVPYLYGSALYLGAGTVGQDNNSDKPRWASGWEDAFAGIVDGGTTEAGHVWLANVSYGRQPYCIGNGILICQIAASGGERAADFAWPRWAGKDFFKAQVRWNDISLDAFHFTANDYPSTDTTLEGLNLDFDNGRGLTAGATLVRAVDGTLKYFLPDGQSYDRAGLRVVNLRAGGRPSSATSGAIWKLEWAQQTHDDFDMLARAYAAEVGWQFGSVRGRPSLSFRTSRATGDDPSTPRYERWDLLYSGGDIDTWVQGQLMKNIQYNSNVRVNRVMLRGTPFAQWRLTGMISSFRADTLNNLGGVISQLAGPSLGTELLLAGEYFASRNTYWRFSTAWLWPGSGVRDTLPDAIRQPWWVAIAQFNLTY